MRVAIAPRPDPLKIFGVQVKSKTPYVRVEVTIGNQKPFFKKGKGFKLEVKSGERVTLRAMRKRYEEQVESFLATGDKVVVFELEKIRRGHQRPRTRPRVIHVRPRVRPRPRPRPRPRGMGMVGEGTLAPMFD